MLYFILNLHKIIFVVHNYTAETAYFLQYLKEVILLQIQVAKSLEGLSDDNLKFLLEMINRFMKPTTDVNIHAQENKSFRPLGMYKHEQFCADGYDIDEDQSLFGRK